jgi:hypothetical protein
MFKANFEYGKREFRPPKHKKISFPPIDISLAYFKCIRLMTSIYTRFTSFEASHVYRNFQYGKREFHPPKRKNLRFAPIDNSLAYLAQISRRTSIYTRFTSFGAGYV